MKRPRKGQMHSLQWSEGMAAGSGEAEEKRVAAWGAYRPSADTWTPQVWVPRRGQEGKAWNQVQLGVAEMPEEEKQERGRRVR